MNHSKITITNLELLRKILEGESDVLIDNVNSLHSKSDIVRNTHDKQKSRKRKQNIRSDFYLSGDKAFIRSWLKQKKQLDRLKKIEANKQKNEEKLKNEILKEENEKRIFASRESYNIWLKEIRKRKTEHSSKSEVIKSNNFNKSEFSEDAFNKRPKEIRKIKTEHSSKSEVIRPNEESLNKMPREIRKEKTEHSSQPEVNRSNNFNKSEVSEEAFNKRSKEIRKVKTEHSSQPEIFESNNFNKYKVSEKMFNKSLQQNKVVENTKNDIPLSIEKLDAKRETKRKITRPHLSKEETISEPLDENLKRVIIDLRKTKLKQKEKSKKRIDSGIFFFREKDSKSFLHVKPIDNFQWIFDENENERKNPKSQRLKDNNYKIDKISHEHENPFKYPNIKKEIV